MRRSYSLLLAAALLAAAAPAAAQTGTARPAAGLELGARVAYAWPFGKSTGVSGDDFDQFVDHGIPLWAELNYWLGGNVAIGAYFQYAWVDPVASGLSGRDTRLGGQLLLRLANTGTLLPWLGGGVGWEWTTVEDGGKFSVDGFDFMVQGGADYRLAPGFALGPFVAVTFGQYRNAELTGTGVGVSGSGSISDKAFHEWLQVGIRGTFDF